MKKNIKFTQKSRNWATKLKKNCKIKKKIGEVRHKNCIYVDFGTLQLEEALRSPRTWNANHLTEVNRDECAWRNVMQFFIHYTSDTE